MPDSSTTFVGNVTRDPELRYTTGGRGVTSFGLAVNRRYQVNGEWQEQVSFFNVVAWAELGENIAASIQKGNRVIVTGRMEQRSYENKQGEKQSVTELTADACGPDLRWATAEVERISRDSASGGSQGGARGGGGRKPANDMGDADEEMPF